MTPELFIAHKAAEAVKEIYGTTIEESSLQVQVTRKDFEGDFTLVVFPLVKISKTGLEETGKAIGEWLKSNVNEIENYNIVKGFLNLSLSNLYWRETLDAISKEENYGMLPKTGKNIMVEFSSPNTNKPLHLGHIRNNLLGAAVSNLLSQCGNNVIKSTLINDRGIHICKSMYAWQQEGNGETPRSSGKKGDHLVGDYYVAFNNMYSREVKELMGKGMTETEAKKEAPCLKAAHDMLIKWENEDKAVRDIWEMMNSWVLEGFDRTYEKLGITFDKVYFESKAYLVGKEIVRKGLDAGVFVKDPDGSVWCDLTDDGLDRKLLLRGDGTSVYITQDLGTVEKRFDEYNLDSHVYVVGDEQNYHFQVLKLILKKLKFDFADNIYHLSYGMVELPEGKMKSREGTVVDADDLIDKMYEEAKAASEESGKSVDLDESEKEKLYYTIGLGALKYFILKVDPKKTMVFNPKESIDFNGNTGPFIQYTYARIKSILRKAEEKGLNSSDMTSEELNAKEIRLVKLLNQYPSKVAEAGAGFAPSVIANYCYDLAKEFNQYYHDVPILKEENTDVLKTRLLLIRVVSEVLSKAMGILGIQLPERM
ncbi:MAG: arginine--tRNA ligase [Candidatus Cryptobacteroides sp.]